VPNNAAILVDREKMGNRTGVGFPDFSALGYRSRGFPWQNWQKLHSQPKLAHANFEQ
jgi:hypothetical protein